MIPVGKFDRYPLMRQTGRWEWVVEEVFSFHDPVVGVITCPAPSASDLASIRILREVFRWGAIIAVVFGMFSAAFGLPLVLAIVPALIALAAVLLYAYIAGYGNRMGAMHDFLYRSKRSRKRCATRSSGAWPGPGRAWHARGPPSSTWARYSAAGGATVGAESSRSRGIARHIAPLPPESSRS